jgi:hypothetical protein
MRSLRVIGLAGALILLACGAAGAAAATPPAPPGELFLLQAEGGSLTRGADGDLRLVLRGPDRTVVTFADRPARVGGARRLGRFVAGWARTFGDDPPNAALQIDSAPVARDVVLLELGRPRYDRADRTVTFRVRRLRTTRRVQLSAIARRADGRVARRFGRASLFIDDGPSAIGYQVSVNLLGGVPSGAPVAFSLTLDNSQFQDFGQLEQGFGFGRTVTPSLTVDLSAQALGITLPSGMQILGTVVIDLPAAGRVVQGDVVLPFGYQVTLSSEAGSAATGASGPISIPAPAPPR